MQFQGVGLGNGIGGLPLLGGAIRARRNQAMQHGYKHRPLQRKAKTSFAGQLSEHTIDAQFLPQPLEDQSRTDATRVDRERLALGVGAQHRQLLGETPQ